MAVRFIGNDRKPMSLGFMRSGRLVPRRRAGRAARFADGTGTRSAKAMGVPGNRMPRMLEKTGARRSRAGFAGNVFPRSPWRPGVVSPMRRLRSRMVLFRSMRFFLHAEYASRRDAGDREEGFPTGDGDEKCAPLAPARTGLNGCGGPEPSSGRTSRAGRVRYSCTCSTRLASATLSGASSKT